MGKLIRRFAAAGTHKTRKRGAGADKILTKYYIILRNTFTLSGQMGTIRPFRMVRRLYFNIDFSNKIAG
jgi:hypothetical protein